jgi:hypothetical protein
VASKEKLMELAAAHAIVDTLAQGIHPVTGEVMPEDSPYCNAAVIRALFTVSQALNGIKVPVKGARDPAPNAGKPWTAENDQSLCDKFTGGADFKRLAVDLGRTPFAVEARLVHLGKVPPRAGLALRKRG